MNKQVERHSGCLMLREEAERIASAIEKGHRKRERAEPKRDEREERERKRRLRLWATTDTQHTAVDRVLTSAAEGLLYFDTEHFFAPKVGLYFCFVAPTISPSERFCSF